MYYLCSENKGADQLCDFRTADLRLCFRIRYVKSRFSHDAAHLLLELYDFHSKNVELLVETSGYDLSFEPCHEKPAFGFPTRIDTKRAEQPQHFEERFDM